MVVVASADLSHRSNSSCRGNHTDRFFHLYNGVSCLTRVCKRHFPQAKQIIFHRRSKHSDPNQSSGILVTESASASSEHWRIGAHHLVILMVEDMAVPDVAGADCGIEGVMILPCMDIADLCLYWCPACHNACHLTGKHLQGVFPANLVGIW